MEIYTTTPLSKFCYKCDPRLQNIKYIKKSVEQNNPIMETKTHTYIFKNDHIQDKLEAKISSLKYSFDKNISEDLQIRNDDAVKTIQSSENFENASLALINHKIQIVKDQNKYGSNKKIAITNFPFAKLKNPTRNNLCFLNSAIQFILSIQPIADLLIQQHVMNNLKEMSLSQDYLTAYFNEILFLQEFESLAVSMLQNPKKSFIADTLARKFQNLGICDYNVGEQWDSSEIVGTFLTFYEKFANAMQLFTLKSNILKILGSIKTKVKDIRKCTRCGEESVREESHFLYYITLEKKVQTIFDTNDSSSPEFKCQNCNAEVGNLEGSLITGAKLISKISSISSYMLVHFGRIMENRIDKNLQKITIPKINNFTVTTDNDTVDNVTLNLEAWIEHHGSSIYSGHYTHIRRYKSGFITMDDDSFTVNSNSHVSNSSLCFLALLKRE